MFIQILFFVDDILEEYFLSSTELANEGMREHPLEVLLKQFERIWFQEDLSLPYNLKESDMKMIQSIPRYKEMLQSYEEYVNQVRQVARSETIDESPFSELMSTFVRNTTWYSDKKDMTFRSESTFRYTR
jgi:hypothetical protein